MPKHTQYPCHFCGKRELEVSYLGYGSCKPCAKKGTGHANCPKDAPCRVVVRTDEGPWEAEA